MAAAESTKFQVNFKLHDGTLINIYAQDQKELESSLTTIQDTATLIGATAGSLGGGNAASYVARSFNAEVVGTAPAFTPAVIADGHCKHGALVWRESKPGAPKEWKGWFCPSPKGTPDQCEPKFVR
jgi:hypothetical protein